MKNNRAANACRQRRRLASIFSMGVLAVCLLTLPPAIVAQDIPPVYRRAAQAMAEKDYITARRLLSSMLMGRNLFANAYWRLALCFALEGRFAEGEVFFKNLLVQGAPPGEVYSALAILAKLQNDRRRNLDYCWLAVQNRTYLVWIYEMLLDLAPADGQEKKISAHLNGRVAQNPEDWLAQYALAYWEMIRGRPDIATSRFAALESGGYKSWRVYHRWAIQLMVQGKLDAAQAVVERGLALGLEKRDFEGEGQLAHLQAHLQIRKGNLNLADSLLSRSEQLSREFGYLDLQANVATTYSGLATRRGLLKKAMAHAKFAQALAGQLHDQYALMVAHHYAADAYRYMGLFDMALQEWTLAYQLADSLKNLPNRQLMAHNLAILYQLLGDDQRALPLFEETIAYAREGRQILFLTSYLYNYAISLSNLDRPHEARRYYEEASLLARQNDLQENLFNATLNLAIFWQNREDWRMAEQTAAAALQLARSIRFDAGVMKALPQLAEAEFHNKKWDKAVEHFHESQQLAAESGFYSLLIASMAGLGKTATAKGDHQKAASILAEAAVLVSQRIFSESAGATTLLLPAEKELFFALSRAYVYLQKPARALEVVEQMRDLTVRRRLQRATVLAHKDISDSLRRQNARLDTLILRKRLQLANILPNDTGSGQKMNLQLEIAGLEQQQARLWESVGTKNGMALQNDSKLSVAPLQMELKKQNELALIYLVGEDGTLIFTLDGDTLLAHEIQFRNKDLRDLIREINPVLHYALGDSLQMQLISPMFFRYKPQVAWQLYQLLLAPSLEKRFEKNLLILPDEHLHFLPFEILLKEAVADTIAKDYRQLPFLLRDYTVRYASSLRSAFITGKSQPPIPATIFALAQSSPPMNDAGDAAFDLWQTQTEIEAIQKTIEEGAVKIAVGAFARRQDWRHELTQHPILHFAAHSEAQNAEPLSSRIILEEHDGMPTSLYAFEIFAMNLPKGRLAFLSSCNTASGVLRGSEGLQGFVQAFRAAGVPSVIGSLWPAEVEATSRLAEEFYGFLHTGESGSEALRQAKLWLMENGKANPFYWAAFQYYGVDQKFRFRQSFSLTPFIGIVGLALLLGVALRLRLNKNHRAKAW
jgi:CHAT domain-containing protein/tetratricopeptide (TPR) repeat protein